ncbi:Uncharacterized protein Fot_23100 [Forsythia ovata]|uniref:Uncharacterized protein n=1 Tax=Forsythia ovata TaxID=205694 RepID=A0ABD1UZL4_9LAMI
MPLKSHLLKCVLLSGAFAPPDDFRLALGCWMKKPFVCLFKVSAPTEQRKSFKSSAEGVVLPPKTANKQAATTFIFGRFEYENVDRRLSGCSSSWVSNKELLANVAKNMAKSFTGWPSASPKFSTWLDYLMDSLSSKLNEKGNAIECFLIEDQ